jgi:hypothetical protein
LNRAKNRIEQLCQAGNIKVSSVATDLFGVSGRKMLKAIVEGKRDAGWMADYARGSLRGKRRELELALEGTFSNEQRWLLEKELRQVEWLEKQVEVLEEEIERRVAAYAEPIRRLVTIPGIDRKTAWTIIAEVGIDMRVYGDAKHLASWAGLCPGNRESAGKRMSGRTRKANRYIKRAMCQAAWAASHTKQTYLAAFYRRMSIRKGAPKAVMALAHHMLTVVYQVLAEGAEYIEMGADYYDQRNKPRTVSRLLGRLARLGYYVSISPIGPVSTGESAPAVDPPVQVTPAKPPSESEAAATGQRRRGRPCKCEERGIICKHRGAKEVNSLIQQPRSPVRFS